MGASDRPSVRRRDRESPKLWRRGPLERWLGAGVGALLGGLLSLAIPLWLDLGFWLELGAVAVALPVVVCAVAGYLYGDRAIHGIVRIFRAI